MFYHTSSEMDVQSSPAKIISGLTRAKREIICNYVVYLHASFFMANPSEDDAFAEYFNAPLPEKLRALHSIATNFAKSLGANEQEINDTVAVTSVFCTYQRSLGVDITAKNNIPDAPVYSILAIREALA